MKKPIVRFFVCLKFFANWNAASDRPIEDAAF